MTSSRPSWCHVAIEKRGRIAIVRFDRGDNVNALSLAAMRELTEAAEAIRDDSDVYAAALIGGEQAFSAGRDLKDPELDGRRSATLLHRRHIAGAGGRLCKAWADLEQFTACGVEGFAIGDRTVQIVNTVAGYLIGNVCGLGI